MRAFSILLLFPLIASAQKLVVDVNLTMLSVSVQDQSGRPVTGLTHDDFQIFENDEPRAVSHFSSEFQPLVLGLAIDRSISTDPVRKQLDRTVMYLMENVGPGDQAFLMTFSDRPKLDVAITSKPGDISRSVQKSKLGYGTRFYDTVIDSLRYLAHSPGPRRALIIVSDGADHGSAQTFREALDVATFYKVPIYVVAYVGDDPSTWSAAGRTQIRAELLQLAEATGGEVRYPKDPGECLAFAARILDRLRTEYVFGFYSSEPLHFASEIRVHIRGDQFQNVSVRALPATPSTITTER